MPLFWDASGLDKRYTAEQGRETANRLFSLLPLAEMSSTPWGYAETYSILLRRYNNGLIDAPAFRAAVTALQTEVVEEPEFVLFSICDETIFTSIYHLHRHNLNATDAALLALLLELEQEFNAGTWVLV